VNVLEPTLDWLRRLKDPLRNSTQIGRWMARLPAGDVLEIQRQSLELLANFPIGGREANAAQVEALLKLDQRVMARAAQLGVSPRRLKLSLRGRKLAVALFQPLARRLKLGP
jgi:hypothetical protein